MIGKTNMYWFLLLIPGHRAPNIPCNFLSDNSTKNIFCSNIWSLILVPDTIPNPPGKSWVIAVSFFFFFF